MTRRLIYRDPRRTEFIPLPDTQIDSCPPSPSLFARIVLPFYSHSMCRVANALATLLIITLFISNGWGAHTANAQTSLVERLSGFDRARVERAGRWAQQPSDRDALQEAAKLVYRLRRVDRQTVQFAPGGSMTAPGDAVRLRGKTIQVAELPLPQELADLLELPRLFRVTIDVDGTDRYVITERVPRRWLRSSKNLVDQAAEAGSETNARAERPSQDGQVGWTSAVEGIACAVDAEGAPVVVAATAMQWYPTSLQQAGAVGVALLSRHGFDAGLLDQVATLQQQPLQSDERDAFYGMLSAAGKLDSEKAPSPELTGMAELLQMPQALTGRWIRVPLRTVRITRVAVTSPYLLELLGQDHYWQIDGMGALGDLVVTVEVKDDGDGRTGDERPQVTFASRYPVSVAALRLPDALRERMDREAGAQAVVAMLRQPITVDGFYYRLWSYDSEFMQRNTGRQQFGPLLIASRIRLQPPAQGDPRGAAMIGWVAAAVFLIAVAVVITFLWRTTRGDDEATRRRRNREAEDVHFPTT